MVHNRKQNRNQKSKTTKNRKQNRNHYSTTTKNRNKNRTETAKMALRFAVCGFDANAVFVAVFIFSDFHRNRNRNRNRNHKPQIGVWYIGRI